MQIDVVLKKKKLKSVFCSAIFNSNKARNGGQYGGNIVTEISLLSGPDKIAASVCGCVSATLHCH